MHSRIGLDVSANQLLGCVYHATLNANTRHLHVHEAKSKRQSGTHERKTDRLFQWLRMTRCLECFYLDYDMFRHAGSISGLASSDVTENTLKRARGCGQPACGGVSGLLKATSAGRHSDQSRSATDAPRRGWTIYVLGKFTSWDRDARSAIGLRLEG